MSQMFDQLPPAGGALPEEEPAEGQDGDAISLLKKAADLIRQASDVSRDDAERSDIASLFDKITTLIANEQKASDTAMGISPAQAFVRRATQGGAEGAGY